MIGGESRIFSQVTSVTSEPDSTSKLASSHGYCGEDAEQHSLAAWDRTSQKRFSVGSLGMRPGVAVVASDIRLLHAHTRN